MPWMGLICTQGLEVSWMIITVHTCRTNQNQVHHGETKTQNMKCPHLLTSGRTDHWVWKNHCLHSTVSPAEPSQCLDSREMRRKFLTTRPKNLTTLDLLIGDEILYRDENYFADLKSGARQNPSVIQIPRLSTSQEISDSESSSESIWR